MLIAIKKMVTQHAWYETDAIFIGYYIDLYPMVRSLLIKLPKSGRDDARTWCICRPFFDPSWGDYVFAVTGKIFRIHKRQVGANGRMEETYLKVKGLERPVSSRRQKRQT